MSLRDRNGELFTGTKEELKRHNNKLCKQIARAKEKANPTPSIDLSPGIAAALERVCAAGGFENATELFNLHVLRLDKLLASDRHLFDLLTSVTVTVGDLSKYYDRLNKSVDE